MELTYDQFLESKIKTHIDSGFDHNGGWEHLYPFQEYCVKLALKKGRFAMFEDCGLGKSRQQLTWAHEVVNFTNKPVIILAPLAVVAQTIQEGKVIGIEPLEMDYEENQLDLFPAVYISNYEQLENLKANEFVGIVLDESSIIKNFEGAYRNLLIENFGNTPYKLCCTATPSPNDPMELGNHAEFLNAMSYNEMLAMYFVHDGGETAKWRLKGHCEKLFWDFVSSWAIMLSKPSDIGFSDEGYNLPPLEYIEKMIVTEKKDNGTLFNDTAISATTHNAELRLTKIVRLDEVATIVNSRPDESFIIWVKQNEEGETLRKLIPEAIEVQGSDSPTWKRDKLLGFANNQFRVLITKAKIGGFGMNFQNCHNMIFASPDFSFESLYQSIRREWRFGQKNTVNAWLITTDTMQNIIQSIKRKQAQFEDMQKAMQQSMNSSFKHQNKTKRMELSYKSEMADIRLGDCVTGIKSIPDESIGFSIFSPPFAELYTYSDELEDMGNSKDYNEFFTAFKFLVSDLFRVLWSGRNVAVHCMDLPIQKGKEGYIGLRDFSGMILHAFQDAGFIYHSRVTIWKDPVTEMQRTKALGLLHKQVKKDAAMSRVGIPDYLLIFRKPGEHKHPVRKDDIPVDLWQKYASPVWMDIDYGETLNRTEARAEKDEKHICPLQLQTIERAIHLWSNEGDTVLTPFMGIGSEVFKAIQMGRKGIGFELKTSYFNIAEKNIKNAEKSKHQAKLLF
jgi:DNA modification methylase